MINNFLRYCIYLHLYHVIIIIVVIIILNSETVKTRMQVSGGGLGTTISGIASGEGISAFWKGIVFAYGRELS